MKKRILSILLTLVMVIGMLPTVAHAAGGGDALEKVTIGVTSLYGESDETSTVVDKMATLGWRYDGTNTRPRLTLNNYNGGNIRFYQDDDSNTPINVELYVYNNCTINGDLVMAYENNAVDGVYDFYIYLAPGATLNINGQLKISGGTQQNNAIHFEQVYNEISEHKSVVNIKNTDSCVFVPFVHDDAYTHGKPSLYVKHNIEFNASSDDQTIDGPNVFIDSPARVKLESKNSYWCGTTESDSNHAINYPNATYERTVNAGASPRVVTYAPKITKNVTGITLSHSSLSPNEGNSINYLKATVSPADATNKNVTWSSSDPSVATVNQAGFITGIKEGTATITAKTDDGGYTATCTVTVKKAAETIKVTSITLNPTSIDMKVGDALFFPQVAVSPADATNKNVTWSSSDTSVFTVDEANGFIEAVGIGSAKLIATAADGSGAKAECEVNVIVPVTSITLNPTSIDMKVGDALFFPQVAVSPADATNKNVTWSSSDTSVFTVDEANGFIEAVGSGSAKLIATAADGSGVNAECTVTVTEAQIDQVSVNFTVPSAGDSASVAPVYSIPGGAEYEMMTDGAVWREETGTYNFTDTFEAGKTYSAVFFLRTDGTFADSVTATINDGALTGTATKDGTMLKVIVPFTIPAATPTPTEIDAVSVNFTVPSAGDSASAAPVYSIPGGAEYEMMTDGAVWREETGTYNFTDTFEAGKTYSAVFFLKTVDPAGTFADSVTATINDGALTGTATKDGNMLKVIVPFTIPAATPTPTEIDAVSVNFTVPSAGDSASAAPVYSIPGGAEYEMMTDGAVWREETGTYNFTDTFEAGKTYSAVFFLKTVDPAGTFADSVTATINDGALTGTATKDGTMLKVIVPFTIPAATPTPTEYDITVTGGTASVGAGTPVEKATAGTVITLTVDESAIPAGKVFDKWEVVSGGVTITDGKFTMPANAVEIRATYKDAPVVPTEYDITVTGGTASANKAVAGTVITLTVDESAIPAGKVFDKWEVVSGGVTVADGKFTMPANAVEIRATYKDAPVIPTEYNITVTGGTASANKAVAGTVITLTVDESAIPAGKVFDKWEVVSGGVTVTDGKFTMPESAVEINATYKDAPVSHTCDIKPVAKDEPSCTEGGKEAYYKCEGCGKFYEDALGAKEITDLANWGNLPKLGHTESDWKSDKDNHWKECTVTACGVIIEDSKAAHKDDNKDGKCDVCEYNVGLPTTPDDDKPNDNTQTGDNSNMILWIALLFVSGAGVVATTVYGKKRFSVK